MSPAPAMPSTTPRRPRTSRKGDIPDNLILKWHSSGPKRLIRRPMTACQTCRMAKVKCDGQQLCNRCTSRGIICRYTDTEQPDASPPGDHDSSTATETTPPPTVTQTTSEETSMDLEDSHSSHRFSLDNTVYDDAVDSMANWMPDANHQHLDDFDWATLNTQLTPLESSDMRLDTSLHSVSKEQNFALLGNLPTPPDLEGFQPPPKASNPGLVTTTPLFQAGFDDVSPTTGSHSISQTSQLFSLPKCRCRESLAVLVPKVNNAMQRKQLDEVFKETQNVVDRFQDIVSCADCKITCTDLICIMALFQQTDTCFEYIARADLGSSIRMNFAGSEILINDQKLRAMLVVTLIHQATLVLDAIGSRGQQMLQSLCTPSAFAQANINHLNNVIRDFRDTLRRMADAADKGGIS